MRVYRETLKNPVFRAEETSLEQEGKFAMLTVPIFFETVILDIDLKIL